MRTTEYDAAPTATQQLTTRWEPDLDVGDTLVRHSVFALAASNLGPARAMGARVVERADVIAGDFGVPSGLFNAAVLTDLSPPAAGTPPSTSSKTSTPTEPARRTCGAHGPHPTCAPAAGRSTATPLAHPPARAAAPARTGGPGDPAGGRPRDADRLPAGAHRRLPARRAPAIPPRRLAATTQDSPRSWSAPQSHKRAVEATGRACSGTVSSVPATASPPRCSAT